MIKLFLLIAAVSGRLAVTVGVASTENVKYTDVGLDDNIDTESALSEFSNDEPPSQSIVFPDYKQFTNKTGPSTAKKTKVKLETCRTTFKALIHSQSLCSSITKPCHVTWIDGYKFPKGNSKLILVCNGDKYKVKGTIDYDLPPCRPVCDPLCKNGGHCVGPNKCKCVGNYTGERCQIKRSSFLNNSDFNVTSGNLINKHTENQIDYSSQTNRRPLENNNALNTGLKLSSSACHGFPNTPKNSKKKCKSGACTISCIEGYQFSDGTSVTNVFCKGGIWSPSNVEWSIVPNCVPICEPPCLNGGNCISPQTCQCPTNFRGLQCQYPESSCDVMKLNFNGNYKCSDDEEKNKCTLWCPQGSTLQPFAIAQVEYTCLYETGNFEPKQIPQCVFATQPISLKVFTSVVEVTEKYQKRPSSCIRWGYGNFKTFDGAIYSVHSECTFTLVSDVKSNMYHIQARARQGLIEYINILIGDNLYRLKRNDNNSVTLMNNDKSISIPNELVDIGVEVIGGQTVLTDLRNANIKILWKSNGILQIDAGVEVWNSTDGLCGNMDGLPNNDLSHKNVVEFTSKWLVNGFNEICETPVEEIINVTNSVFLEAETFCSALKKAPFEVCKDKQLTSVDAYIDACKKDYSYCVTKNDLDCGCNSIAIYAKDCFGHDQIAAWRDETICPFRCPAGKVYSQCLPTLRQTCSMPFDVKPSNNNTYCEEGCICPVGTVEDNGKCISKDKCSCKMRNTFYKPGDVITKECNKCTCIGGEWSCTNAKCQAECYAIGDPHYKTFDGMKFNFMGACSYYLVVLPEFTLEAENIPCDGTMSQEYGYETPAYLGKATCTKTVTIRVGNSTAIKLGQNKLVSVNGEIVDKLPVIVLDIAYIREFSTFFLQVMMTNGIEVLWDGETRLYVHASPELQGKTKGLCGTYNENQKEDLLTPEGDVETDVVSFANKWKTKESCKNGNAEAALKALHPCDANIQFKHIAENYCSNITGQHFSDCHPLVDPAAYYEDCLYDMCSCQPGQFSRCYCQILASYALECTHQGLAINWRKESRECGVQCPAGQHYSPCGNSCQRTCRDISTINACKSNCVEGCYCSPGSALSEFGECIPISECPCYNNGQKYMSEQKRIEGSNKEPRLCTCKSAAWECRAAEQSEITLWKEVGPNTCNHQKHLEFTECEPSEPITCHNMHDPPQSSPAVCYSGCICKKPYVLDSLSKQCVLPTECPCHHGGKSYSNNETYYQGCNTCKCNLGKWKCTKNECNGVCTAWGDLHFQTFDSRYYDFQGACEYVFAKGTLTTYDTFVVSIDVVPCGSTGASCIKSITLTVGSGSEADTVNLKNIVSLPKLKRIQLKEVGIFIVAEVPDIGLVIHWDKGTRVHLQLDPKWKSHVNGLCGNYNDNQMDDFQTPFGGIPEVSSLFFGDSWKLQSYCAMPTDIRDACAVHPHRRQWAHKQCSVLKSSLFKSCHSHVLVDNYIQRCNFDTCACDQGGDCECLCTAIAAYAQECSLHGVNIKWRSQDMCPIQCENGTAYESCIPPCSFKSCDDFLSRTTELCERKLCVEGCVRPHCPQGQVYFNASSKLCVPINSCKIPCKVEGSDDVFNEGDVVFEDKCHTCYCSRNKKICKGQPCVQTLEPEIVSSTPSYTTPVVESQCLSGWSVWIKRSHENNRTNFGFQPLPSIEEMLNTKSNNQGMCSPEKMSNIQCRSLNGNKEIKDITENIECSVEKGISCHGKCNDYEVRVYCECEGEEDNSVLSDNLDIIKRKKNITRIVCPVGLKCKIMCNQICQSFENEIKTSSVCESPQHCISDCVETIEQNDICPEGSMWRDKDTCVHKSDCTCYSRNGTQVKPGGIYKEDSCTVCQCLNNAYVCDDTSCNIHEIFSNEKTEFITTSSYETTNNEELSTPNFIVSQMPLLFAEITSSSTEFTSETNIVETSSQLPTESTSHSTTYTQEYLSQNLETTTHNIVYVPSTVTEPALHCDINQVKSISSNLEPSSFNASSWYNPNTEPYYAQLDSEDNGYWRPAKSSETEYLQMDLGQAETIYGIEVTGNPTYDEYVTSYLVAYSLDGVGFSFVLYNSQPKIFRGPHTHNKIEKQILISPIEARYIRVLPKSWHNEIAIKLALLGCPIKSTTLNHEFSTTFEPTFKPVCSESMGIESGLLNDAMISVSSSLNNDFHSENLSLDSNTSWIPFTASTNQWIQVDFTGPRIVTGIVTKGNPLDNEVGEAWVEAYKVIYSNDLVNWNKILDSTEKEKIFSGNYDSSSTLKTFFDTPIRSRYIRIHPEKWHNKPALRLEILGCFEAYSATKTALVEVTETLIPVVDTSNCSVCPGIIDYECKCSPEKWWNGESCGLRSECPCVIGVMTYQIGTVYDLENCQQCICTIGGVPNCAPKVCSPCPPGEISTTLSSSCRCECEPCKNGTKLCPTSNVCLDESLWCNGVQDCADDERNCPVISTTTPPPPTTTTTANIINTIAETEEIKFVVPIIPIKTKKYNFCPEIKCPEGQIAKILNALPLKSSRKIRSAEAVLDDPWPSPFSPVTNLAASLKRNHRDPIFSTKGNNIRRKGVVTNVNFMSGAVKSENQEPMCKQWVCEARVQQVYCKTPLIACPEGYFLQTTPNEHDICPVYTCVSSGLEESQCDIDGRVFKTFDGTVFKYEVCDHIISRDRVHNKWKIKQIRRCPYVGACQQSLWLEHLNHTIEFFPNMTTTFDGYHYTVNQLQAIGSQTEQFAVKQVQTNYIIFASTLSFNIIWQVNGNLKIKLNAFYTGRVDGLCGFFDNNPKNDKLKRDGDIASTTSEFGLSWADSNLQCEAKICPVHVQKEAIKACEAFRSEPLNQCKHFVNIDEYVMKCVESICSCLENSANDMSECRCKAISGLVTQCYTTNSTVELSDWRLLHDCPVNCQAPFVFKECFNRACEPSCDNLLQNDPCPKLPENCFPGCYCPDGYIKEYGNCIKPSKCRNCICDGSGTSHYTTFDKVDYVHRQNCSHVLVKTTKENDSVKPGFTIVETTGKCSSPLLNNGICVQNLTITHAAHKLSLSYNADASKILTTVDGHEVNSTPFANKWMSLTESPGKSIIANIPVLELEVVFMFMNQGFSIKMPSHLYYDKTEGLCGSCNGDSTDDMAAPDGTIPSNVDEFIKSWNANGTEFEKCDYVMKNETKEDTCEIPKPEMDPCLILKDAKLFGQCHPIVDVQVHIKKCHSMVCEGLEGSFCHSLEAYVRECQSFGICLDWRSPNLCPYSCPPGLMYKACTTGCEETCDNYKALRSGKTTCNGLSTEMCVCPPGQVFNNSVCVNENRCESCDDENHYAGDSWLVDKCTTCTCTPSLKTIRCERKQCQQSSFSICQTGFKSVKDETESDECCEQFKCIPEENRVQNCTDIIMPVCAEDQIVKMELTPNGCKRFICECIPRDECLHATPDKDVELLSGMINVINNQGCCPSFKAICLPETCPEPKPCDLYYEQIKIENHQCCPQYKCELPNNTCIYEYEWIASNEGGERKRNNNEKAVILKQLIDTWEDGPCRSCFCDDDSKKGMCNKLECSPPPINSEYLMAAKTKYGQCCPTYKRESCIYQGTVYTVGSEWTSEDPCKTLSCKLDSNDEAYVHESVKSCNNDCALGWAYVKPMPSNCCGSCVQDSCVMQNKAYAENDTWTYDNCTTYLCEKSKFNEFNILSVYQTCPNLGNCPENRIYNDGCCERCNTTGTEELASDKSLCAPESLPLNHTVGLVVEESLFHDTCTNSDGIVGFTECRGLCDSYTYFNKKTTKHDSKCQCCQPIRYEEVSVSLQCKDGYSYKKSVAVPSACSCTACGGDSFSIKKSKKH